MKRILLLLILYDLGLRFEYPTKMSFFFPNINQGPWIPFRLREGVHTRVSSMVATHEYALQHVLCSYFLLPSVPRSPFLCLAAAARARGCTVLG